MKYFFDTEFIEDGKTIELLSIGMVREDGKELYIEVQDVDFEKASEWVKENVIQHLWHKQKDLKEFNAWSRDGGVGGLMKKAEIGQIIREFIGDDTAPEFYAYYADYDWVVFCQLYGTMMDLPEGFPMFCMDLKQMMVMAGTKEKPPQENEHNALDDARWNKKLYESLVK